MNIFRKIFSVVFILSLFVSCSKLDPLVFKGEKIEAYLLEDYEGDTDMNDIPDSYKIDNQFIHLFTLNSQLDSETKGQV